MLLRSVTLLLFTLAAIIAGSIACGPNSGAQGTLGSPAPTPAISQQQMDATRDLLDDALLDATDVPTGLTEQAGGLEDVRPSDWDNFIADGGWLAISTAWAGGTADVVSVQEAIYAFATDDGATSYTPSILQGMSIAPEATAIPGLPTGATGFERTVSDGNERVVEVVSRVDRLLVWTQIELTAERTDWREVATNLHLTAEQRAQEAITAAAD
jgi:hypothetical protein